MFLEINNALATNGVVPVYVTTTSGFLSIFYGLIEFIFVILIFRKANDDGVVSYVPFFNTLKLYWRTKVLNLFILGILTLILGPSLIVVGFTTIAAKSMASLILISIGSFISLISLIILIVADIKLVQNIEPNPGIMSYICNIFFSPFYFLYMAINKKEILFAKAVEEEKQDPSKKQKFMGSCVIGCLGIVLIFALIIGLTVVLSTALLNR